MGYIKKIVLSSCILLLVNIQGVPAQFFEAGVQKLEVPVKAPNFTLEVLGAGMMSLEALKGRIVILTFFFPSCPVCQKQASSLDELAGEIKNKDAVFLLVAIGVKEGELIEYKKEFHVSLPILIDGDGSVSKAYGVWGHHETFFINREGKIIGKTFAEKDWTSASIKNLIQYLLAHDK